MEFRLSRRSRTTAGVLVWVTIAALSGPLTAQVGQDAQSLSRALYDRATAAESLEELEQVLHDVDDLRQRSGDAALADYLTKLQAWVLHRRGEAYVKRAAEASAAGKVDESRRLDGKAMQDFHEAVRLDPQRWKSYHHRGVCYALAGKFEQALSDFTKTVELRPAFASAWFNRGEIRYELGQFTEALADYDEAIRLQPDDAGYYTSRGHAQFQLRHFDAALADYNRAVLLDPHNPERLVYRGEAYRSLGRWAEAATDFRQAVNRNARFGRALQSAAWLMATCPDDKYRHTELAVRAARKAIEIDGEDDYIYLDTLAAALANQGQYEDAQRTVRRAIRLAPPENTAPLQQRYALYRGGKPFRQTVDSGAPRVARQEQP
ncbi:MAG: tetratricopeptide repeat protein [Pirellulaceae bacterium]|jgi:tetratricopeptide (TPR) repeat protein|nr:tetratricopeptide repeat protein [Pirellulaceae bacterium]